MLNDMNDLKKLIKIIISDYNRKTNKKRRRKMTYFTEIDTKL